MPRAQILIEWLHGPLQDRYPVSHSHCRPKGIGCAWLRQPYQPTIYVHVAVSGIAWSYRSAHSHSRVLRVPDDQVFPPACTTRYPQIPRRVITDGSLICRSPLGDITANLRQRFGYSFKKKVYGDFRLPAPRPLLNDSRWVISIKY